MRRFIVGSALCVVLGGLSAAAVDVINHRQAYANLLQSPTGSAPFSPSCSQSTAWFARAGTLDLTHKMADDTAICGLVTDGTWALLDALWFTQTQTTTAAVLNVMSSSFTLSPQGSPAWVADRGYTGTFVDAPTVYIDTAFAPNPNGVNYTANSASMMVVSFTNAPSTDGSNGEPIGVHALSGSASYILPRYTDSNTYFTMNDLTSSQATVTGIGTSAGSWIVVRASTAANNNHIYRDGVEVTTGGPFGGATAGLSPSGCTFYLLAENACTIGAKAGAGLQIGAAALGGALDSTHALSLHNRVCTRAATLGQACP
jgi:hypothetical protein